jgi:hypothetical protein
MIGVEGVLGLVHRTGAGILDLGAPEAARVVFASLIFDFVVPPEAVGHAEALTVRLGSLSIHFPLDLDLDQGGAHILSAKLAVVELDA